jgi:hypothetical protein
LDLITIPSVFYALIALGGLGVLLALPRKRFSLALPGYLLASAAGGGVLLMLFFASQDPDPSVFASPEAPASPLGVIPNPYFYVFALLGAGGGMRMITHPRPVYSALYFILTIIATSGLYLLLSC